ncbi:hypothetical protein [Leeia oryzae]|uniref:hypothetical protein n=1 Tax=Leeia oryzae TaxID=356662 RepID=UPI00035F2208|nr:hypothetical protein [Leeia oryzae]
MKKYALCAGLMLASTLPPVFADSFSFGLWGDMPYAKNGDMPKMQAVINSINHSDIRFSIYDGDIKDGSSECTDGVYTDAITMFNTLKKPAVYVPGDNEWTDCHRTNNGGYNNLERLSHLRKVMFGKSESFGQQTMPLVHQAPAGEKFSENVRFEFGKIVFVGLNIPGSNNNMVTDNKDCTKKSARDQAQCDADNAEYLERDAANIDWLKSSFDQAKARHAKGLVLVFQADPGFDLPETEEVDESKLPGYQAYRKFMEAVATETAGFKGQVLLVHGDTHFFKVDKPLYNPLKMLNNFTRLQTFGSPSNHWVRVTVDTKRPEVFTIRPVMVEQP